MRRTLCVYCGKRIAGALGSGFASGDPARDRLIREAAKIACTEHRDLAMIERCPQAPVEGGDE